MQPTIDADNEHHDDECSFGVEEGSRPDCSHKPVPVGSVGLPVEKRLRSRIDNFLAGYGLTPMGKAVALNWIQDLVALLLCSEYRIRQYRRLREGEGVARRPTERVRIFRDACHVESVARWHHQPVAEGLPGDDPRCLRSKAFWSAEEFEEPWVAELEEGFRDAREELLTLRGRGGFQPYRAPRGRSNGGGALAAKDGVGSHCHKGGDWNVFYLFLHDAVDFSENRSMCPKTVSLVEALPRHYKHAFLSALAPGTHVVKHNGPTNKKLRVHLPLLAPCGGLSRLRVGSETRDVAAGQALVFDDSFEHEAWNDQSDDDDSVDSDIITGDAADEPRCSRSVPADERGESGSCRNRRPLRRVGQERRRCTLDEEKGRTAERRSGRRTAATRVTLIADVWHPDLSDREVRFFSFLQEATLRLEKRLVEGARKKPNGSPQGPGIHCGISAADENHDGIKVTSDAREGGSFMPSPTITAAKMRSRERHNKDKQERSLRASRRYSNGGTRTAAEKKKPAMTPKTATTTKRSGSSSAGRQRMSNEPPDDPEDGGGRFRSLISNDCAEGSSEESVSGMGTVTGEGGGDAACNAAGTTGVGVDNFFEVIKCARALRSTECNIFGP